MSEASRNPERFERLEKKPKLEAESWEIHGYEIKQEATNPTTISNEI